MEDVLNLYEVSATILDLIRLDHEALPFELGGTRRS